MKPSIPEVPTRNHTRHWYENLERMARSNFNEGFRAGIEAAAKVARDWLLERGKHEAAVEMDAAIRAMNPKGETSP